MKVWRVGSKQFVLLNEIHEWLDLKQKEIQKEADALDATAKASIAYESGRLRTVFELRTKLLRVKR